MSRLVRQSGVTRTPGARPMRGSSPRQSGSTRQRIASALRVERPGEDKAILFPAVVLVGIGVLMVFSASAMNNLIKTNDAYGLGIRQLFYALIGATAMYLFSATDYRRWRAFAPLAMLISITLLIAVLIPGVPTETGLRRSLSIGPFSIHAAEVAKFSLILFLADLLARRGHEIGKSFETMLSPLVAIVLAVGLVLVEPDLGTASILGLIGFSLLFVAGIPLRWVLVPGFAAAGLAVALMFVNGYQAARLGGFNDPFSDPTGSTYQTLQGLIAMAVGGPLGSGLGSSQQLGGINIPYAWNDYIFAVIGEEAGLLGMLIVIASFLAIAMRGLRTARRAPDTYGALLATGIVVWISGQAFVNIAVVLALLPVTGVPLPLVSQGGSSLIVLMAAIGLLLSVSRETMDPSQAGGSDARANRGWRNGGTSLPSVRRSSFGSQTSYRR
jgi:cell division protein FtsW